jgi:hypothetical protein
MRSLNLAILLTSLLIFGCGAPGNTNNTYDPATERGAKNPPSTPPPASPPPVITEVPRPQKIVDLSASRGEQDMAQPVLKIVEPAANAALTSSTVKVKLELTGDLKGYKPGMNEETHTGNHIHVILDNQPYEAYYNLDQPFELRNVMDGPHT